MGFNTLKKREKTKERLFIAASLLAMTPVLGHAQGVDESDELASADVVVVTGLKRGAQSIVDAPAGIASINGDEIEDRGADGLDDFLQFAPGASIDRNFSAGSTTIQIRGVNASFGSASVGFYLDDMPVSFVNLNFLPDPAPFDLERVEVLKGPQGALYGAGSSGGVVLVRTKDPVLDAFEGKLDVAGSGTFDGGSNLSTSGAINIPLLEGVAALRGSVSYQDNSGWIDDSLDPNATDLNGEERLNARVKLLVEPTDALSIKLLGVFSRNDNEFGIDQADDNGEFPISAFGFDSGSETDYNQYGAVVSYEFPWFTASNAFSYISFDFDQTRPFLAPIPTAAELETYVNEFRLNSTHGGALSWVAGFYYRNSTQSLFQELAALGLPFDVDDEAESTQYSIFGEATYTAFDGALELSFGGSYFWDDTSNNTNLAPVSTVPVINEVDTSLFSPQASIAYHPTDNSTIYVRYAEGFRAATVDFGLPNFVAQLSVPTITGRVEPESIKAYEFGAKGEFADGRIYLEGAFFYNDISDIQQSAAVITPGTDIPANTVLNAGDARSVGFEWLISAEPTDGLSLAFSGAYIDAEITDDFFAPGADAGSDAPLFADGTRLNLVPELLLNGSASYTWPLGFADLEATASANVQYSSDRPVTVLSSPSILGDDILRTDLRLEVGRDQWSVYAFADNVNNEGGAVAPTRDSATLINGSASALFDGLAGTRLRPRTIGAGVRLAF